MRYTVNFTLPRGICIFNHTSSLFSSDRDPTKIISLPLFPCKMICGNRDYATDRLLLFIFFLQQ